MPDVDISGDEDSSDESEVEKKENKEAKDVEMKDASPAKANAFDDSDDDDDDKAKKKPETSSDKKQSENAEEDSDDNNKDAKKDGDDKAATEENAAKKGDEEKEEGANKKDKGDDDDLEDSDEDDVEFDDSNAVTGTSHSKGFQKKVSKKKSAVDILREQEEAEEAAARAETTPETPKKPPPPKVDPRTMMVLQPERPPSSVTLHVTKLPNLVGIQPEAFDPDTYSAKAEEEEYKGFVHDMIRWRYKKDKSGKMMRDEDGNLLRESNARLVQWEDGSYTLHVGKEALIVDNVDSSQSMKTDVVTGRTAKFAGLNGYLYLSQMAKYREEKKDGDFDEEDDDDVEIDKDGFKITPAGTVLECMGSVASRFTARPSSLRSEAHKSLTVAVRKKTIKRAQISEIVTQFDPEKQKEERIRLKDQMEKEKSRKGTGDRGHRPKTSRPRMTSRYLEEDDDVDSINLGAIKDTTMNYDNDLDGYGDAAEYGDDDDDGWVASKRKRPKKRSHSKSVGSDDEDEDEEDAPAAAGGGKDDNDDDDEDDDEMVTPVKSSKKRATQRVFDSDDDSDD